MRNRQHAVTALRIFEGPDCLTQLDRELSRLDRRRAVIFCGATLGRAQGAREGSPLELVTAAAAERCVGVFAGVTAHSPLPAVEAGAEALRRHKADAVIAVGGGSAIVTARAASILVAEGRAISELCTQRQANRQLTSPRLLAAKLPQFVVPTTPTTAMTKAGSAVLDPETRSRLALFDPKTRASSLFLHPRLLGSAPRGLFVDAGLNAFCGAVEGLMSRYGDPISDAALMHAVRLCAHHFRKPAGLDDDATRADLAFAAILCGQGTDVTSGGITTALGHAVAAHCGIEGGLAKALILPHTIRFNAEVASTGVASAGLDKIGASLGVAIAGDRREDRVIDALVAITRTLGLASRLRDAGVKREALGDIADKAMADWFLKGNPRPVTGPADLKTILDAAW